MQWMWTCAVMILTLSLIAPPALAQTQVTVSSIDELRQYADADDHVVTLAAGEHWLGQNGDDRTFLRLTGSNSTYDFSAATIKIDARDMRGYGGGHHNAVRLVGIYGDGLTVDGLTLSTEYVDGQQGWADMYADSIQILGSNNTLANANVTVRGSNPYGYGDAFGKGGRAHDDRPFISHSKHSGIRIGQSTGTTIDNLTLNMEAFGHGVYMQQAQDVIIRNSHVRGELASSNDVIAHELYQEYGITERGHPMTPDIMISKSEDGIRAYGVSDGIPVKNVLVENVIVENMREAFSLMTVEGENRIVNSEAWNSEYGFEPGPNTIIENSRGNATHGPLLYYRWANVNDTNVELELVATEPQVGRNHPVAVISGDRNHIILSGDIPADAYDDDAVIRIAQRYNYWRAGEGELDAGHNARTLSIINTTGQNMIIGPRATTGDAYRVPDGGVLGGHGMITTRSENSIVLEAGGRLDPRGVLAFNLGDGQLDLRPGINSADHHALLFQLNTEDDSDRIQVLNQLNIGNGLLGLDDFEFTPGHAFGAGVYRLLESDHAIVGTLGDNVTGELEGYEVTLTIIDDGRTIALEVVPEPASAALLWLGGLALSARRRTNA